MTTSTVVSSFSDSAWIPSGGCRKVIVKPPWGEGVYYDRGMDEVVQKFISPVSNKRITDD